ncbi:Atu4866 domain-containing protein [Caulobacter sp. DWR2-3-1b2]|uniref:Atu4866 domain-containing protein n=1 Tax=Caulobacter sp. DWR2-3-1b2 TaxID=2804642 RepID=UPI0019CBBA47|nr:Atu4866 domain-containing protein [Caulobacter sp.]
MKYYPKIARWVSGVWASADGVALELRMDGRFEERHDGEVVFTGHYEMEGDDVRLFEDGGGLLIGRLTEGRLSLEPPPRPRDVGRFPARNQRRTSLGRSHPLY